MPVNSIRTSAPTSTPRTDGSSSAVVRDPRSRRVLRMAGQGASGAPCADLPPVGHRAVVSGAAGRGRRARSTSSSPTSWTLPSARGSSRRGRIPISGARPRASTSTTSRTRRSTRSRSSTDLQADLTRHVHGLGWTDPITFPRGNDTPLPANGAVFAGDVRAKIEQWYADDFAQFGDQFDFSRIASAPEWTAAQLREVRVRVALHDRLAEVRQIALKHRERAEKANKRADALARQLGGAAQTPSGSAPAAKKAAKQAARTAKQAARKAAKQAARKAARKPAKKAAKKAARKAANEAAQSRQPTKADPANAAPTMEQPVSMRGGVDQSRGWRARLRAPR